EGRPHALRGLHALRLALRFRRDLALAPTGHVVLLRRDGRAEPAALHALGRSERAESRHERAAKIARGVSVALEAKPLAEDRGCALLVAEERVAGAEHLVVLGLVVTRDELRQRLDRRAVRVDEDLGRLHAGPLGEDEELERLPLILGPLLHEARIAVQLLVRAEGLFVLPRARQRYARLERGDERLFRHEADSTASAKGASRPREVAQF